MLKKNILFSMGFGLVMILLSYLGPLIYNYPFKYNPWLYINRGILFDFDNIFFHTPLMAIGGLFRVDDPLNLFFSGGMCMSPWYPSLLGYITIFIIYFVIALILGWVVGRIIRIYKN